MRLFAVAALAALVLSACQEPAGVGLGLIDEEQSDPRVRTISLSDLDTVQTATVTFGLATTNNQSIPVQSRVLAGSVVDPEFGDVTTVAYIDFSRVPELTDGVAGSDILEAWVELDPNYVYGDTTTALPLELRPILGSWDVESEIPPDSLFTVGEVLSTTEIASSDSLRRFDIPQSFVRANADLFVSDGFGDNFDGFALQVPAGFMPSPGAVIGFGTLESQGAGLRLATASDTLVFPLFDVFTSIDARPPLTPPSMYVPVRAGSRAALQFKADFSGLGITPLANARLLLPTEQSLYEVGPFVRPVTSSALLFGIRTNDAGEDVRISLGTVVLNSEGVGVLSDPRAFTSSIQQLLFDPDARRYDRFEVLPNPNPTSLDVLPFLLPNDAASRTPRITLTLVGESL